MQDRCRKNVVCEEPKVHFHQSGYRCKLLHNGEIEFQPAERAARLVSVLSAWRREEEGASAWLRDGGRSTTSGHSSQLY